MSRQGKKVYAASEEETQKLAQKLAARVHRGAVITLQGTLGAGKTTFVRAFVEALGGTPAQVSSPTFSIIHYYDAPIPVAHADAYRLESEPEAIQAGIEELFDGNQIVLIEWPEHIRNLIPEPVIEIEIQCTGETEREFRVAGLEDF